jgi:hypothetical protein
MAENDKGAEEDTSTATTQTDKILEQHYFNAARRGIVLSVADLSQFCKTKGIRCSEKKLASLRYRFKYVAIHARYAKPSHYMGSSIERLGTIMVDVAEFKPNLRVANSQARYFLAGVDSLTGMLSCIPCPNKARDSWEKGIRTMVEKNFNYVGHIITDRDAAVTSEKFRSKMKSEFGISWTFLRSRSKAFKVRSEML